MKLELNEHASNVGITLLVCATIVLFFTNVSGCERRTKEVEAQTAAEMAKAGLVQKPHGASAIWAKP